MDQISQQVESSGIRKETVFWVANIARHESIEGRRSFNLEVEDIPNFQTTSAWEFDSRFKALESGPREVIATTLNRTKRGVPVSRSYFFPGFEGRYGFRECARRDFLHRSLREEDFSGDGCSACACRTY